MTTFADVAILFGPLVLGWLSSLLADKSQPYGACDRAKFAYAVAPPGSVFGVVWTVLYILYGLAGLSIYRLAGCRWNGLLTAWLVLLLLTYIWYIWFTRNCSPQWAFWTLLILALLFVALSVVFFRLPGGAPAGTLLIPLIIWLLYASYLIYPRQRV